MSGAIDFGPFRYDPAQRVLFRGANLVSLPPKALDTLHVLLENQGRIVDKAELMRRVWPDTTVEEIGLARNISILRKALGDDFDSYIETIPKRGYRFNGPAPRPRIRPRKLSFALAAALALLAAFVYWQFYRPSPYLPGSAGRAALAVIPFESDPSARGFADAFNDILPARLANLPNVQLTSPSTVRRYLGLHIPAHLMARILSLHVLLEGTIHRDSASLRITTRLADVHSGKLIWAETHTYPLAASAAGTQATLDAAAAIATQVGAHLSIRQ